MLAFLTGQWEWIVVLIVALLLFGSRLPSVMRALGKSLGEFKKGVRDMENEVDSVAEGGSDADETEDSSSPAG